MNDIEAITMGVNMLHDGKNLVYKKLIQLIVDDVGEDAVYKMIQECVEDWDTE